MSVCRSNAPVDGSIADAALDILYSVELEILTDLIHAMWTGVEAHTVLVGACERMAALQQCEEWDSAACMRCLDDAVRMHQSTMQQLAVSHLCVEEATCRVHVEQRGVDRLASILDASIASSRENYAAKHVRVDEAQQREAMVEREAVEYERMLMEYLPKHEILLQSIDASLASLIAAVDADIALLTPTLLHRIAERDKCRMDLSQLCATASALLVPTAVGGTLQ